MVAVELCTLTRSVGSEIGVYGADGIVYYLCKGKAVGLSIFKLQH